MGKNEKVEEGWARPQRMSAAQSRTQDTAALWVSNTLGITQLLLCVFRILVSACCLLLSCSAVPMQ